MIAPAALSQLVRQPGSLLYLTLSLLVTPLSSLTHSYTLSLSFTPSLSHLLSLSPSLSFSPRVSNPLALTHSLLNLYHLSLPLSPFLSHTVSCIFIVSHLTLCLTLSQGSTGGSEEDKPGPTEETDGQPLAPPPGHEQCAYCGSVMPQIKLIMHERHCAQSTFKCPVCKYVWNAAKLLLYLLHCQSLDPIVLLLVLLHCSSTTQFCKVA